MKIVISEPRLVLELRPAISTDPYREQIGGFSVDTSPNGGLNLVSTNGHIMFILHDPAGSLSEPLAVRPIIKFSKWMYKYIEKENPTELIIETDECSSTATLKREDDLLIREWGVVGTQEFPNWRTALPVYDPAQPNVASCFNPDYLAKFSALADGCDCGITLFGNTPKGAFLVMIQGRSDFVGLIMPRNDTADYAMPEWLSPIKGDAA